MNLGLHELGPLAINAAPRAAAVESGAKMYAGRAATLLRAIGPAAAPQPSAGARACRFGTAIPAAWFTSADARQDAEAASIRQTGGNAPAHGERLRQSLASILQQDATARADKGASGPLSLAAGAPLKRINR